MVMTIQTKKRIVGGMIATILATGVTLLIWVLVRGASSWTIDRDELLNKKNDIIFRVGVLYEEDDKKSSSKEDIYLEFMRVENGGWVFHSLNGPLQSKSGTCVASTEKGENHEVRLNVDNQLMRMGIYTGFGGRGRSRVKFIDKIEGDDAKKKRVEVKKMKEWDLGELRNTDRFDVTILGSKILGINAELEFKKLYEGNCIFFVLLNEGQTLDECKIERLDGQFGTRLLVQSRMFLENKIQKNKAYAAHCSPNVDRPGTVKLYVKFVRQKK